MDIVKNIKAALSTVNGKLSELKEQLAETNRAINLVDVEIDALYALPISLNDWSVYFKKLIQETANNYAPQLHYDLMRGQVGCDRENEKSWSQFEDKTGKFMGMQWPTGTFTSIMSMHQIMSFYFPDVVHERLMARFKENLRTRWGNDECMPVEDRRKKVAELMMKRASIAEKRTTLESEIATINDALKM